MQRLCRTEFGCHLHPPAGVANPFPVSSFQFPVFRFPFSRFLGFEGTDGSSYTFRATGYGKRSLGIAQRLPLRGRNALEVLASVDPNHLAGDVAGSV